MIGPQRFARLWPTIRPSQKSPPYRFGGTPLAIAVGLATASAATVALGAAGVLAAQSPGVVPCPMRAITGIPCPFCGMTHSLIALGHHDLSGALSLAPAIPLIVLSALAVIVIGPARLRQRKDIRVPRWLAISAAAAVVCLWGLRLAGAVPGLPPDGG